MTYKSRGRSVFEVAVAVTFVGFLTGFVAVLCIGNYYRAKRAMERQRERRMARQAGLLENPYETQLSDSPRSNYSGSSGTYSNNDKGGGGGGGGYGEQQHLLRNNHAHPHEQHPFNEYGIPSRRSNVGSLPPRIQLKEDMEAANAAANDPRVAGIHGIQPLQSREKRKPLRKQLSPDVLSI